MKMKIQTRTKNCITILLITIVYLAVFSCRSSDADTSSSDAKDERSWESIEVFDVHQMKFNGKIGREMNLDQFETVFGEPDSIQLLKDLELCTNIFEHDGGLLTDDNKFLFKDSSRFENYRDSVVVDEFRFTRGAFLNYKGIKLDETTSEADIRNLFPNAMKGMEEHNVGGEGRLKAIQLREDEDNISDGMILVFFRDGYLYSMQWWFPC